MKNKVLDDEAIEKFNSDCFAPYKQDDFILEVLSTKNNQNKKPKIPKGTRDMNPL